MSRLMSAVSNQTKQISKLTKPLFRALRGLMAPKKPNVVVPSHVEPSAKGYEEEEALPSSYLGPPPLTPPEQLMVEIQKKMMLRKVQPNPRSPHVLLLEALSSGGHQLRKTETLARPKYATHTTALREKLGEDEEDEEDPNESVLSVF
jgi:hypothetical protein